MCEWPLLRMDIRHRVFVVCQPILGICLTLCQRNIGQDMRHGMIGVLSEWLNDWLMSGLCLGYVRLMSGL